MSVALSYDSHAYKTPTSSKSSVLIIPIYLCQHFIEATKNKKVSSPFITDTKTVTRIKDCITQLKRGDINEIEQRGYIHVILGIVMDNIFSKNEERVLSSPTLSSKLLIHVNENFKNAISLDSISSHFGYTKVYVSRWFSKNFGVGFCEYLSSLRLKNAMLLLNEGRHSITECALESGFGSMRSFYRIFHQELGCSPREYLSRLTQENTLEKIERRI